MLSRANTKSAVRRMDLEADFDNTKATNQSTAYYINITRKSEFAARTIRDSHTR